MMFVKIKGARIAAVRSAVPDQEVRIEDELEYYGGSLKKVQRVKKMIGTDRRRLAWPGQTASDLCYEAAKSILESHPEVREQVDCLIFVTQSPDYELPASACILQHRLGLPQTCAAFDVNQGCAGFVYALWLGASLLAGGCRHVLVMAGDAPGNPRDARNRVMASIFGDGGGAALLSRDPDASPLYFSIGTDGSGYEHLIVPAARCRFPLFREFEENRDLFEDVPDKDGFPWRMVETYMNGGAIFSFTMRVVPEHVLSFLKDCGVDMDSVDYFVFHQANKQIVSEIAKKAGLPLEKAYCETFSRYGNLSSASIPAVICDIFGEKGSTGQSRLLLCGYGVGLAWAACLWDAADCDCAPVIDAPAPEGGENYRKNQIEYWKKKFRGEEDERR